MSISTHGSLVLPDPILFGVSNGVCSEFSESFGSPWLASRNPRSIVFDMVFREIRTLIGSCA
jgi:hypothetical protein